VRGGVKLREAKTTTLRSAARALMRHGNVVGEVEGVDEVGVRVACRGARSRGPGLAQAVSERESRKREII
jgi:hypothetical protein